MKTLTITSIDSLDSLVADIVRLKIRHTGAIADKELEIAAVDKRHTARIMGLQEEIAEKESIVRDYCDANRADLFSERKSRETPLAVFGFEITPPRVETASRKIKWRDVLERLLRLSWGKAYIRNPEPQLDKNALLADRETLTHEQTVAAGIQFCQDEQWFLRPKPETAEATVQKAA